MNDPSNELSGTIYKRIFKPNPDSVLYHYCGTATFLSILENGRMRFSDINMMNDIAEWAYAYELWERAADALLKMVPDHPQLEGLDTCFLDLVDAYLSPKQLHSHPVIACFSKAPDVLSQWRGYADYSRGWAIGFSAPAIAAMPVTLLDVLYDPDQQLAEVRNFLAVMYIVWRKDGGEFRDAVGTDAALLASLLHAYKHPSFAEECEVRALHELRVNPCEDGLELIDEGGLAAGEAVDGQAIMFRASDASIVAHVDIPLQRIDGRTIAELWFGPSNPNALANALFPLTRYGHRSVELCRSASSYRI